ncbi:metal-dependent hydrolase [Ureibacillus thermophilus]|uniref:metal-dependent hydrolase n=1 Tax=Ureibacillus thermophilus TaxID=367743 RepID=UPI00361C681B
MNKLFGHRGITHTLIFSIVIPLIIAVIAFYGLDGLSQSMMMYFSIGLFVGILSHLILDAMTKSGVPPTTRSVQRD